MQNSDEFLDPIQAEMNEAKLLVEEGLIFETESRSIFRFIKKKRYWHIKPLNFGTILHANRYAMELKMNFQDNSINAAITEMDVNIKPLVNYISVCVLGSKWKIKLFRRILTNYFLWRLSPNKSLKLALGIMQMYDLPNFITSIRLIGTITSPQTQENPSPNPIDGNK